MEPVTLGIISIVVLVTMILCGFHVAIALALCSFGVIYLLTGGRLLVAATLLETTAYSAVMDYVFAVIPLFVLMGLLSTASGATTELFQVAERATRRLRGGLGVSTVLANAVFAAITGVSVASAAVFSKIAVPEMERLDYDRRFSLGIVASSSLLGMLIPPSVLMIVYCLLTEQSIGRLFAAGLVPGLLVAFVLCLTIWVIVYLDPRKGGTSSAQIAIRTASGKPDISLLRPWPVYLLIVAVLGGIYLGVFTPTEAGAIGAAGALILFLGRGRDRATLFRRVLTETGGATASIFFLLIAAQMYSRMLTLTGLPTVITDWVTGLPIPPMAVIMMLVLLLLLLGMILDSISILLLTMPVIFPVVVGLGYDPIWFGIIAVVTIEIGLLTPPFGMVIFAMKAALPSSVQIEDIYIGSLPFILALLATLLLLLFVPQLSLWLPNLLYGG